MFNRIVMAAILLTGITRNASAQSNQLLVTPTAVWRVEFGGRDNPLHPSLRLGLVQMSGPISDAHPELISINFTPTQLLANLAGVPLMQHKFRLSQQEEAPVPVPAEESPWYSSKWLWVAGAAAVGGVAILASSKGDNDAGPSDDPSENNGIIVGDVPGDLCVTRGVPPLPDTCFPVGFQSLSKPVDFILETIHTEDDANSMGDLILR